MTLPIDSLIERRLEPGTWLARWLASAELRQAQLQGWWAVRAYEWLGRFLAGDESNRVYWHEGRAVSGIIDVRRGRSDHVSPRGATATRLVFPVRPATSGRS